MEEATEKTNDLEGLTILNTPQRRIASVVHLIITAGAYIGLYIRFESLFLATVLYLIGYFLLHLVLQKIPYIGHYKPGYYEVWRDNEVSVVYDDNYEVFYGFASLSFDVIIEALVYTFAVVLVRFILPTFIFYIALLTAIAIIVIKYILFPFANDIINICSRYILQDFTEEIRDLLTTILLILAAVVLVASFFVFPLFMPATLDMGEVLDNYYHSTPNPFYGTDLSDSYIEFKEASTVCVVYYEGEMVSETGLIKTGTADITFQNHLTSWRAEVVSINYTGMKISPDSPVEFKTEAQFDLKGYDGLAIISAKFEKYEDGVGEGVFTVTDKESGEVKHSSRFTTSYRVSRAYPNKIYIYLETPLNTGFFGWGSIETNIDFEKESLNLVAFALNLKT